MEERSWIRKVKSCDNTNFLRFPSRRQYLWWVYLQLWSIICIKLSPSSPQSFSPIQTNDGEREEAISIWREKAIIFRHHKLCILTTRHIVAAAAAFLSRFTRISDTTMFSRRLVGRSSGDYRDVDRGVGDPERVWQDEAAPVKEGGRGERGKPETQNQVRQNLRRGRRDAESNQACTFCIYSKFTT